MTAHTNILVVAEHDHGTLKSATLNTVTAASQCGGEMHILVAGHNAQAAAQAAAGVQGVAKVLHADAPQLAEQLAENVAAQVFALAGNYGHILFPATAHGKNVAPRVAAKLDVAQLSDVTKVHGLNTFERPIYAGNAIATVQSLDLIKVITVRTTGFDPAAATDGSAEVELIAAVADSGKSAFVGSEITKNDRPELTAAKIIVSGGRALGSSDKFNDVLTPLADKLGAALGASRKVWTAEVEALLYRHPAIQEACVIAAADARRGETVKALVVLKPGHELTDQQIIDWSREHMAAYKSPRFVQIVPSLPKSGSGKVMWRELQERENQAAKVPFYPPQGDTA